MELINLSICLDHTRYTARPIKKSTVRIIPPFLRPETDRQIPIIKVEDNGVQCHDNLNKVRLSTPKYPQKGKSQIQIKPQY